ncbi:MAG TPA: UbiA-like polyprenyltransferase [Ferruginibacter sp.]|nr:UbiA-like polyprenyltransferase [Ferruginibacter sp.]
MIALKKYLSLVKFSHTIFAMPFALVGFFLGIKALSKIPHIKVFEPWKLSVTQKTKLFFQGNLWIFLLVILCMVFARSAAMAFNRWLDKNFDAKNPRTSIREIPAGIIKSNSALWFVIICSLLFVICCYFINNICFFLSPVALFVVLFYSYTKRFTALCHLVLGVGLSLAPIGAYLAVTGQFALLPVLFSFTVLFWVSGFDIIYALQDEEFDKTNKLHSIPAALGKSKALLVSNVLHLLSAISILIAGLYGHFGLWYWVGVIFFCGLLIYQHLLVKPNDLSKVNVAFFTTNGIASLVFAFFVILDIFLT